MDPKMQKFIAIGTKRTENAIHSIELLGNLSNRSAYLYTDELVNQMFDAIEETVRQTRAQFKSSKASFAFKNIDMSEVHVTDAEEDSGSVEDEEGTTDNSY